MKAKTLDPEAIYQIKRKQICGYNYAIGYDEGRFIQVRVLAGPDPMGNYKCTTRGNNSQHLGPGGGWEGESIIYLPPSDLEKIAEKSKKIISA